MRLRISSLVFGISVGLATVILLYQILSLPPDSLLDSKKEQEGVAFLDSRLKHLEEDIRSNHDTIKEIKMLIKSLSKTDLGHNLLGDSLDLQPEFSVDKFKRITHKQDSVKGSGLHSLFNFSKASIQQDDCIFSQSSPLSVDIQMKDVYDLLPFDNPDGGPWKQGWRVEYDVEQWSPENKLKVFVVPHSHCDPGWIKTFEKYFEDQARHILDNMVVKLPEDHRRKFIWAEVSFFALWWDRQSMEVKDTVERLVESGQFEIVTGGWVMTDEADAHYFSMVDQLLTGHEWLQLNLGVKPNNGWAIDPFGLSPTMAYILKKSGLQNMVIQRTHYSLKKHFAREKNLEFRWRQIWDTDKSTDILCHMMPFYSYDVPHTCGPDPKICCQFDFNRLPGSGVKCPWRIAPQPITSQNVDARARLLLDQYRKKAQLFKTNVLLVQLGDDFRYDRLSEWDNQFNNYQKLFDHMNDQKDLHVQAQFGTLADYFRALREEVGQTSNSPNPEEFFPSLSGDFFTYSDRDKHYWSGYFTSRPFYKHMDRVLHSYLRCAEIMFSLMLETETHSGWTRNQQEIVYSLMDNLAHARKHFGLFQHHDALTGTSKNHVVVDYANKLLSGIRISQHVIQNAVHSLLSQSPRTGEEEATSAYFELGEQFAEYNTIPEEVVRRISKLSPVKVYILNPDLHKRQQLISIRIDSPYAEVRDRSAEVVPCQIDPIFSHEGNVISNEYELHFVVTLDALSLTEFSIHSVKPEEIIPKHTFFSKIEFRHVPVVSLPEVFATAQNDKGGPIYLEAGHMSANFTPDGLLRHFSLDGDGLDVSLSFVKYGGGFGGAYLFLPPGPAQEISIKASPLIIIRGPLRSELILHQYILRHHVVLKNSPGVDGLGVAVYNFIDMKSERNSEVAMRFRSGIKSDNIFYTDLNGFQVIKRVRYDKLPIQGNYYPMPTQMFIEDQNSRLSLFTAQPLGCSSLQEGEIEVMLDRQLTQDDERGLGHGVHDNIFTLNSFVLLHERKIQSQESILKEDVPSGFPSLTAHASINLLNYPSHILHSVKKNQVYSSHWNIGGELPCDVELVNLRSLIATRQPGAPHPPSSTIALTLHRVGFSCSFPSRGLSCVTNNGKIRLSDLFPGTFSEEVKQMSLSHLYEGVDMSKSYTLSLHPMELYSFKLFISSVN